MAILRSRADMLSSLLELLGTIGSPCNPVVASAQSNTPRGAPEQHARRALLRLTLLILATVQPRATFWAGSTIWAIRCSMTNQNDVESHKFSAIVEASLVALNTLQGVTFACCQCFSMAADASAPSTTSRSARIRSFGICEMRASVSWMRSPLTGSISNC